MTLTITPIESLPSATVVNGSDLLVIKQSGVTKKVTKTVLGISEYETTKLTFLTAGVQSYTPAQYEKIIGYTFIQGASPDTIKITNDNSGDILVDTTDDNTRDFNYFTTSTLASFRKINVELDAAGTVYLHSIKNLVP